MKAPAMFEEARKRYVRDVSTFAIPLSLTGWLWEFLLEKRPASILDDGSGWTTYVFAMYAKHHAPGMRLTAWDTSRAWLQKTHDFLAREGLLTLERLEISIRPPVAAAHSHDLVFADSGIDGDFAVRIGSFDQVLAAANRWCIVDDWAHMERAGIVGPSEVWEERRLGGRAMLFTRRGHKAETAL